MVTEYSGAAAVWLASKNSGPGFCVWPALLPVSVNWATVSTVVVSFSLTVAVVVGGLATVMVGSVTLIDPVNGVETGPVVAALVRSLTWTVKMLPLAAS